MPYLGNSPVAGDHVNNFKVLDDISSYTETFDGSASTIVSTSNNTIRVVDHRFIQGQRVTYTNGGGGNIGGLTTGTAYFVIFDTASTFKLATNASNAANSVAINLSSVGSGSSHTLNAAFDGVNTKFKITYNTGTAARFNNATQLNIAINNVLQKPNLNSITFTEGFAIEDNHKIVFKVAPTSQDIFWGSIIANTLTTFDISDHKIDTFTGDGSTTEFTLSHTPANNESLMVTINGVLQHPSNTSTARAYTLIASIIQFTAAPGVGDEIQVRHLGFAGATTADVSGFYGRTGNVVLTSNDHITTGDITARNINASGILTASSASFGGDVSIGGTLTYEDVTNIDSVGLVTARDGIFLPDGKIAKFGNTAADPDLEIYHGGTNSIIKNSTGRLYIGANDITVSNRLLNETKATFNNNSSVDLHFNGTKKFETSEKGIQVGTGVTIETNGQATFSGITTFSNNLHISNIKEIRFGNNHNSPSMFVSHDGSVGRIQAPSTGIFLGGPVISLKAGNLTERMLEAVHNGAVTLYYDSSTHSTAKLATTATGVTIDGTTTTTGLGVTNLAVSGITTTQTVNFATNARANFASNNRLQIHSNGTNSYLDYGGSLNVRGSSGSAAALSFLSDSNVLVSNSLSINDDLDVDGHTNLDNVSIAGIVTATDSSYHQYYALGTSTVGGIRFGNNTHTNGYIYYDNGANMNFQAGGSERLRITDDGFIGINEDDPKTGLTISKLGDYSTNDGNTYYIPVGKWSSAWNKINAVDSNTDYWVGFVGGYHKTGNSVNISLAPNRGNLNAQQGMYISGEATAISSSDFAIGKIVGGNTLGQATSGGQRATKSELFRISNSGNVGIATIAPQDLLHIGGTSTDLRFTANQVKFYRDSGRSYIDQYGTGDLSFRTTVSGTQYERIIIQNGGNVLVGTTDSTVYANGDSASEGIVLRGGDVIDIARKGDLQLTLNRQTNDGPHIAFYRSGGQKSFISTRNDSFCIDVNSTNERLRIDSNGNVQIGTAVNAGNTLRYLDVANYNTGTSAGAILRLLTTKSDGSSSVGLDIVKYKSGGAYLVNYETVGADTGFIALSTGQNGASPTVRFRVAGNGETIITPTNGGASYNRTSIHFNNANHSPFIAFKSNNVTEAAYLRVDESGGGANYNFQTKNTSGTILSRLTLKHNGEIVTHQLAGNEKGFPLVMGTGTVANNTNMSGSLNMHDINGVHTSGGANYHIGGWVFLGNDQAAAPYPARRFKIFAPNAFTNGTIVYQVWHDGDSNYDYGGLYEIRINCWTDGDIESVSIRCVNGRRDDLRVVAYNDSNGIMVQPSSIWGRCFIRRFGYDDGGRNPGSSYCAVANNGALAIYNSQGTDDGALPSGGFDLYTFGTSDSSTHTGGRDIENSNSFPG